MHIEREDEGVWLQEMPMWVVDTLLCLPEWIESDNPDVRARLLPKAYEDEQEDKEWREALGSSLEHLVAKRTEIVRGDLQSLEIVTPDFEPTGDIEEDEKRLSHQTLFNVWIPAAHVSAWISTLQAGTHAIFILDGLTAEDVDHEVDDDLDPEKQISIVRLSILQEILVRLLED
jgi:hypothetical protein